jgi:mycoredoxin
MDRKDSGTIAPMKVQMYTAAWCRDCRAAKQFLDSHGIEYTEINVDSDPAASAEVLKHVGKRAIPQLVIDGEWFQPYRPGRGLLYDELYERFGITRSSDTIQPK